MASNFTPGKWWRGSFLPPGSVVVYAGDDHGKSVTVIRIKGPFAHADGQLIAAAPKLCRTLIAAYHALKSYEYGNFSAELAKEVAAEAQAALIDALGAEASL